ncbi:hypothetical protein PR202_ga05609 [Eleusine coracana subsp. coracana]|uniref:MATH domain-containing protein n=1 Tax=Eleusine coracana subsp. coracana TaxID=191504 RepID=A0AAV5BT97_ELECO|nr:hypothetical protein PR202_ga05155 [Eleusine coracana subsp. coracana]GJM89415.1 hypothetical protein PR202_ga05609 [Eleusine coracana subsp. coracana]
MAGSAATDDSAASTTGMRDDERSLSGDSLSEWRSCERVDSDSPSTSPPFWDTDGDDDDPGPRPSDLFGRYTWRIENFSKEKKREMKSEPFEAGGYKWYILVYPQGCDVSNHLSLFLCVANHDKLLPGWSHFAQFTIAVGNIDPKKMKYSDTLHRFWKKEHDWGWKKFMELSKIQDGFLVDDVLEIIAQVQIYRRFVEERRSKLSKLIEDKTRWSSFRAFWSAIDPSTKHRMSREKADTILKVLVKHFFVEKEVTSTLVMDSLYTSMKALEYQKGNKGRTKLADLEELPAPMVHVDMDIGIEIAYQEAVAFKRQEELIREEEAAGLLENQMKGKRSGGANEKDKRAKKKQTKQKKNNRKVKDKERTEKNEAKILERLRDETAIHDNDSLPAKEVEMRAKVDVLEDCASDGSDISTRGKNQRNKGLSITSFAEEGDGLPSTSSVDGDLSRSVSGCGTAPKLDQDTVLFSLRDKLRKLGQRLHEKNIEGQKLLKAHLESKDAKTKAEESSNSSCSSEKPPDVLESPKHSSEVPVDLKVDGTLTEEAVLVMPATNSELMPLPVTTKVDPVSDKDNPSSSKAKACVAAPCCSKLPPVAMDKDAPLPSKSPRVNRTPPKSASDKTTPVTPKSPPINRATPVHPKSSAADKATSVRPKSPAVDKATSIHPKSSSVDKAAPVRPKSPVIEKGVPVRPKSPAVQKAAPVRPNSPAVDKASPALLKSPTGTNDASIPSRSLQIDKSIPAPPRLVQVDKGAIYLPQNFQRLLQPLTLKLKRRLLL